MSLRKRFPAVAAATALLAIAAPVATAGAAPTSIVPVKPAADICLSGVVDPGPLGPAGPYGPGGPYGADGPLAGRPNPIGNAAQCGGLLTYALRGGTVSSFVNANLASVGITP